ncbi:MAG: DUF5615 family PIN-like protein [Pyrinomonadaceae bacterium]
MIRFLADEDFSGPILAGVKRRLPDLDIIRVWDTRVRERPDPEVLEFAASEDRVILSHDLSSMEFHARARIQAGKVMPGLFLIRQSRPIGPSIEDIVTLAECSRDGEWTNRVEYLPL